MSLNQKDIKQITCCYCKSVVDIEATNDSIFLCMCSVELAVCRKCANRKCPQCNRFRLKKINRDVLKYDQRQKSCFLSKITQMTNSQQNLKPKESSNRSQISVNSSISNKQNTFSNLRNSSSLKQCQSCDQTIADDFDNDRSEENDQKQGNDRIVLCKNCKQMNQSFYKQRESKVKVKTVDQAPSSIRKTRSEQLQLSEKRQCVVCREKFESVCIGVMNEQQDRLVLCKKCKKDCEKAQIIHTNSKIRENPKKVECIPQKYFRSQLKDKQMSFVKDKVQKQQPQPLINVKQSDSSQISQSQTLISSPSSIKPISVLLAQQNLSNSFPNKKFQHFNSQKQQNMLSLISETIILKSYEDDMHDLKRKYSISNLAEMDVIYVDLEDYQMECMQSCIECRYSIQSSKGFLYNLNNKTILPASEQVLQDQQRNNNLTEKKQKSQDSWFLCSPCACRFVNQSKSKRNQDNKEQKKEIIMNCGFRKNY